MGKASYTDRKLTDAERSVAQKYYYLVSYFIWKKHLTPMTEWEGELAIPYIQAIKKYSDYDQLHCFSIKTVIFYALDSARANYFKKEIVQKEKQQVERYIMMNKESREHISQTIGFLEIL